MSDPLPSHAETQSFEPVPPEPDPTPAPAPATVGTPVIPDAPARPGASRGGAAGWVNIALAVALAVAIGGIGFAAGRMTAPASATGAGGTGRTFGNGQFPAGFGGGYFRAGYVGGIPGGNDGNGGFRGVFGGGGASIQGTVESISGDALTLKLADGQTIQISLSGTTTYHAQAAATSSDVKTGGTVIVRIQIDRGTGTGTASTTATDVTVVP